MNLVFQKTKKTALEPSLEEIAKDLRDGRLEEENFKLLFEEFYPKLFRFFHNSGVTHNEDISDLIQNTFFKVYKNIDQCRDCQKFGSWIFSIARNDMKDWFRKKKKKPLKSLDKQTPPNKPEKSDAIESGGDLEEETIQQELYEIVLKAIKKLPKRMRECVLMWADSYSYAEIATALRISPETVKSQLYKGRKRLKVILRNLFDLDEFDI